MKRQKCNRREHIGLVGFVVSEEIHPKALGLRFLVKHGVKLNTLDFGRPHRQYQLDKNCDVLTVLHVIYDSVTFGIMRISATFQHD